MNESRKKQFVSLMKDAGVLPVYCYGDDEICLRAGYLEDGTLLTAIYELGIDPMESLTLYLEKEPFAIKKLESDGSLTELKWEEVDECIYRIQTKVETMNPVFLFIKY